ncbi:MAG: plasma membrane fusion protein prm1 [Thelocarpon superellum]|nr:MAG: plasma membrane fusion protein prm1 [Thelocarpon superellum]
MSSTANGPSSYPAMPSTLRDHDPADPLPPAAHTAPGVTPYLGLHGRLSQVWLNKWTVLIFLLLVRLLLAITSMNNDIASARKEALSACTGVESMGSAMASLPHYMAQGTNDLAATGVEKAVNGLMSMLMLSLTGVEEIVVFVLNLLTSTYVCLITLVISGSLHVALQVAKDVADFLNKTLGDITTDITTDISSFQNDLNTFTSALNSVPKIFGSSSTIPTLNINSSLDKLDDLQLPSTLDEGLQKLNSSIPTFAQVQNFTDNVIRTPFEAVKTLVNQSMVAFHFDRSVFPVPQKEQLTFCSDNNGVNGFFDGLVETAYVARKIFLGVLVVLAILACIPMAYRDIRGWRTMHSRAQLFQQKALDPLDVVQIISRPYTSTAGIAAANKFQSPRRQVLVRWFVAYITTPPALFVLMLGLTGLMGCLFQYMLLKAVEREVPALAAEVGDFAGQVINKLESASTSWANGANGVIDSTNHDINTEILGWVNTTTGAVNDTLNAFSDQMSDALNATFAGTVLLDPITEVLNCLIGLKIAGIEKGLTWVSDNAHVDFPTFPNNTFSLGAVASLAGNSSNGTDSFLANPSSESSDLITSAVDSLLNKIADGIQTEALISLAVVMVWVAVVIIGLLRTLMLFYGRDRTRAEGGPSYNMADVDNDPFRDPAYRGPADLPAYGARTARDGQTWQEGQAWHDVSLNNASSTRGGKVGFAGERNNVVFDRGLARSSSYGVMDEKR